MKTRAWFMVLAASIFALGLAACEVTSDDENTDAGAEKDANNKTDTDPTTPAGDECDECMTSACSAKQTACDASEDCVTGLACARACDETDVDCPDDCVAEANWDLALSNLLDCWDAAAVGTCSTKCTEEEEQQPGEPTCEEKQAACLADATCAAVNACVLACDEQYPADSGQDDEFYECYDLCGTDNALFVAANCD